MKTANDLIKASLTAERDEDGELPVEMQREFASIVNPPMAEKYGANAFTWPLNDETRAYFELCNQFNGEHSPAAVQVLGL